METTYVSVKISCGLYNDVIMSAMASQITSLTIVYSSVYSGADQRKHQSSASLAFVWGIHWWPVNSPYKWPATRYRFPFDDVIMNWYDYQDTSVPKQTSVDIIVLFFHMSLSHLMQSYLELYLQTSLKRLTRLQNEAVRITTLIARFMGPT